MKTYIAVFIATYMWLVPLNSYANILKIGVSEWPPYENISNKEAPGFSTEVVRQVLSKMGTTIKFTDEYPWKRTQQFAYVGKLDAVFSVFFTEERAKKCHFPDEPLIAEKHVLFIQKEDAERLRFDSFEDLRSRRIGLGIGNAVEGNFNNFLNKNSTVFEVLEEEQLFIMLADGRVDYVLCGLTPGLIILKKLRLTEKILPILSKPLREDNLYIMFSKKTVELEFVQRFSDTLKAFKQEEPFRKIYNKYFLGN